MRKKFKPICRQGLFYFAPERKRFTAWKVDKKASLETGRKYCDRIYAMLDEGKGA